MTKLTGLQRRLCRALSLFHLDISGYNYFMTQYLVYDVFTDPPFGGNQLAVFPDAAGLPEDKLQSIAAEFNFSEVTFVYPPTDPDHTAQVRIFTPTSEVDFAGHPTIGTLIALSDLGHSSPMVLEVGVGPIIGEVTDQGASFTATQPLDIIVTPYPLMVANALGVKETAIKTKTHLPVRASMGLPFVLVELKDLGELSKCCPNPQAFQAGADLYPASHDFAIFAYVRDGALIESRMFAPLDNIPEDPATGSASATLAALLTEKLGAPQSLSFTQGVDMGRPSHLQADTTQNPVTVTIKGQAVKVMSGDFIL